MKVSQAFKLALKSLAASKMRSFLTMLGIIIGVAAVIILVSLVSGFSNSMTSAFESMGTNLITVNIRGRGGNVKVDPEDFTQYAMRKPKLFLYVSPTVNVGSVTIKYGNTNFSTTVTGANEMYANIKNYAVSNGRFLSYLDVNTRQNVCVIGNYNAKELFGSAAQALGNEIKISGDRYKVVGVVDEKDDSSESSVDDFVVIPYTIATRLSRNKTVTSYSFAALDADTAIQAKASIQTYLYDAFQNEDYYSVTSAAEAIDTINNLTGTLTLVLVGIAGISLLVGGIGIMNIMLVSVTERTKEIGIRKSLGGKRRDIMNQFVIEAATTSAMGGIIGILLGIAVASLVGNLVGLSASASVPAIIIAFSVSVGIGIVFGYFPAAKASKLNPIDALRFD